MFTKNAALRALFAGAGVAAAGAMGMATASADDAQQATFGAPAEVVEGGTVQQWAVGELRPSSDVIGYAPAGTLWEATATNTAVAGGNIPYIPGFSARGGADAYPVLWGVATPAGVNPSGLAPGQAVTGKLYFDVTGAAPSSVAWQDRAVWVAPPPPAAPAGGASAPAYTPQAPAYTPQAPVYVPPASAPVAQPAPAAVTPADPAPAASAPAPASGSSGTPIAESAPGAAEATPAQVPAAETPAAPAPASQAPATAAPAAPASEVPASEVPTSGSAGTPLTPTATATPSAAPAP